MFTKTQAKIMEIFVSKITMKFSINEISRMLEKTYAHTHNSIISLIDEGFITRDDRNLLSLNYAKNFPELAFIESLRVKGFLAKNKTLNLFINDILDKLAEEFFILLIFGSSVEEKTSRDIDILVIIQDNHKVGEVEKHLNNLADNFSLKFDINVISVESMREMLSKRDKINVLNETLNKHLLLFGAENYYRILKNAR